MLAWLFPRRGKPAPLLHVTLYTRAGCHLCEDAHALLERAQKRYGFSLGVTDIDTEAELLARYDTCVPVVLVNGKLRFRGRINPILLERLLKAESRKTP